MQTLLYGLRKERNLTQEEMADKIGISENAYRQKEKGQRPLHKTKCFSWVSF